METAQVVKHTPEDKWPCHDKPPLSFHPKKTTFFCLHRDTLPFCPNLTHGPPLAHHHKKLQTSTFRSASTLAFCPPEMLRKCATRHAKQCSSPIPDVSWFFLHGKHLQRVCTFSCTGHTSLYATASLVTPPSNKASATSPSFPEGSTWCSTQ